MFRVVFDRFLIRNDDQCVVFNRNLELPVQSETDCEKITLVANVVRISQEFGQRIHESSDSHNEEAGGSSGTEFQGPGHELQIADKSAIDTLKHVKYGCNLASLPLKDQQRVLNLYKYT